MGKRGKHAKKRSSRTAAAGVACGEPPDPSAPSRGATTAADAQRTSPPSTGSPVAAPERLAGVSVPATSATAAGDTQQPGASGSSLAGSGSWSLESIIAPAPIRQPGVSPSLTSVAATVPVQQPNASAPSSNAVAPTPPRQPGVSAVSSTAAASTPSLGGDKNASLPPANDKNAHVVHPLLERGFTALNEARFEDAHTAFQQILAEHDTPKMVAQACTGMAGVFLGQRKHADAIECALKSLEINTEEYGIESGSVFGDHHLLGVLYPHVGQSVRALESNKMALRYLLPAKGENYPQVLSIYKQMVRACITHDNLRGALQYAEKVLAICRATKGEDHVDTAKAYETLGLVYRSRGGPPHHGSFLKTPEQYERAADYLSKALGIFCRAYGNKHVDTARVCMQLAGVKISLVNVTAHDSQPPAVSRQDAIEMCFEAKMFHICNPVVYHFEKATYYREWAKIHIVLRDYTTASEEYLAALHCFVDAPELDPRDILQMGEIFQALGGIHVILGNLPTALAYYESALRIYEVHFREHEDCYNVRTARAHMDVAAVYDDQGEKQLAMQHTEHAIRIYTAAGRSSVSHEKDPEMAMAYVYMANMCVDLGRGLPAALENWRKALDIYSETLGADDMNAAQTHVNIALALASHDRFEEAVPHYRAAYPGFKNYFGDDHAKMADWAFDYANTLKALDRLEEALPHSAKALSLRHRLLGSEHEAVGDAALNLGCVQVLRGNLVAAIEYFREAKVIYCALFGRTHAQTVDAGGRMATTFGLRTTNLIFAARAEGDTAALFAALNDA